MKRVISIALLLVALTGPSQADSFFRRWWAAGTAAAFDISGGIETNYALGGTNYEACIFKSNATLTVTGSGTLSILLVGGGGGPSGHVGAPQYYSTKSAGGGGGAVVTNATVSAGSYSVVIGAGGITGTNGGAGYNGSNTTALGYIAYGGGGGNTSGAGNSGGCGGAGATGGAGTNGQGYAGGADNTKGTAGGGGANATGGVAVALVPPSDYTQGGSGGAGKLCNYSGVTNAYYGGGGGGGGAYLYGYGGAGGGGRGYQLGQHERGYLAAANGTANTGGGAGACYSRPYYGDPTTTGGTGIVIFRRVVP